MTHILFLDFDGVLHPDELRFDQPFCFMENFCEAVRDSDSRGVTRIVISSSWRTNHHLDELVVYFPMDIAIRIVGVTPNLVVNYTLQPGLRQTEIETWMAENAPNGKWLAIDDRAGMFQPGCQNLFHIPHTDTTLEAEMRAATQPLSEKDREAFRRRKWNNRSVGLTEKYQKELKLRLVEFLAT